MTATTRPFPTTLSTLSDLAGAYTLDPAHSRIGFVARHAMIAKVRGSFDDVVGSATITADGQGSLEVAIQAASVDTRQADRDAHLRGADFFDTETYPQIRFTSTQLRVTDAQTLELTGQLTIKDVSRQLTIPLAFQGGATDPFGNDRVGFEGSVKVSRKDFGLTWNAALETGGVLVGDQVTLEFEISAIRAG